MTENKSEIEILAPAGSYESLRAAIKGGCDAVYFGVEQLNMRAKSASHFTTGDMNRIAEIAKAHNIKTYLTLNTVMYDHDLRLMKSLIDQAKKSGITGIIASDHAAMAYTKKQGMPLHVSTQANVSNIESVEFFAAFADVIVLARELSLSQVKQINRLIKKQGITGPSGKLLKTEIFAHGALCMAISGKCYLSLHSHNAAANRGVCIQNCRHKYVVTDKEDGYELEIDNEYIMSAKDLCTIDFLDKILDAGVTILKIEGRGRSADYVYTTVRCYKEAVLAIQEGRYTREAVERWKNRLSTVFNRGFWEGYYLGRKMGEWADTEGSKATLKKVLLGKGVKYFDRIGVGEFTLQSGQISQGDELLITGPTTGIIEITATDIRVDKTRVEKVNKGSNFSMSVPEKIRPSDKLYKIVKA